VIFLFFSAESAGEAMYIVVMLVVRLGTLKTKERHREDTARPKREKRIIGKQKIVVDTVRLSKKEKTWMIHLPQCCQSGVRQ
jgi:hypothetical protein